MKDRTRVWLPKKPYKYNKIILGLTFPPKMLSLLLLLHLLFSSVSATLLPLKTINTDFHGRFSNMGLSEPADATTEASNLCNIFNGKWVFDETYPLYSGQSCSVISTRVNCESNGRPDRDYLKWRWQPDSCNIPRFNGGQLLESLRGKRVMIVGDSLDRGMWESLVCLIQGDLPDSIKSVQINSSLNVFQVLEYNTIIEFFWAPLLVDVDTEMVNGVPKRVLKVNSIETNADGWRDIDILVFNSASYWTHPDNMRIWDYVEYGNGLYEELDRMLIYQKGMQTWANWVDSNLSPQKTRIFFRSISPIHTDSMQWDKADDQTCANEREPITNNVFLRPCPPQMQIMEAILEQMSFPIYYLNVTMLSDYRKDAHPSIYISPAEAGACSSSSCADCSHWCVPGLPDTWNQFLYYYLI